MTIISGNTFLHLSNRVERCYAIVHGIRMFVRSSVAKCHRKQTTGPRSINSGTHIGMLTKQVRLPIFSLILNVLDLNFERQMFRYTIFLQLLHDGLSLKDIFWRAFTCRQGTLCRQTHVNRP